MEVRTRIPTTLKVGDVVYCVQTGTHGDVKLCFSVAGVIRMEPELMWDRYWDRIQYNYLAYSEYLKNRKWAYGIEISNVLQTNAMQASRPPQWFTKLQTV